MSHVARLHFQGGVRESQRLGNGDLGAITLEGQYANQVKAWVDGVGTGLQTFEREGGTLFLGECVELVVVVAAYDFAVGICECEPHAAGQ